MDNTEKLMRAALGRGAVAFETRTGRRTWHGWMANVRQSRSRAAKRDPADAMVEKSWRQLHEHNIRFFAGASVYRTGSGEFADHWGEVSWMPGEPVPPIPDPRKAPPGYTQVFAIPGMPVPDIAEFCLTGGHGASPEVYEGLPEAAILSRIIESAPPEMAEQLRAITGGSGGFLAALSAASSSSKRPAGRRRKPAQEPWRAVKAALAKIMKILPFEVQFASQVELRATFVRPVSAQAAGKISPIILEVNPEAMELAINDLEAMKLPVPLDRRRADAPDYEAAMALYLQRSGKFKLWWD